MRQNSSELQYLCVRYNLDKCSHLLPHQIRGMVGCVGPLHPRAAVKYCRANLAIVRSGLHTHKWVFLNTLILYSYGSYTATSYYSSGWHHLSQCLSNIHTCSADTGVLRTPFDIFLDQMAWSTIFSPFCLCSLLSGFWGKAQQSPEIKIRRL